MPLLIDNTRHFAVEHDGLPRVARYDDGSQHVLYLEDAIVRSMEAGAWLAQRGPLPVDPTQAQIDAAILTRQQAVQQAQNDAAQLRQQIIALAQSTVGMRIDATFTAAQLKALLAIVLWQEGAIAPDMTIRPLAQWADRRV